MNAVARRANPWASGCLVVVGLSHHTAPVEVREQLSVDVSAWHDATRSALPSVLVSTCNRVEVYAWGRGRGSRTASALTAALARVGGVPLAELRQFTYTRAGSDALVHLVRVAAGLDSLVVGEEQIRGQVHAAHAQARAHGKLPAPLEGVMRRAVESGRRIRSSTRLGQQPSVASAGVAATLHTPVLADVPRGELRAVVLGAGAVAKAAAQALLAQGISVTLCNRTPAHAERLAHELGRNVRVASLDALPVLAGQADVLVGATAARQPVVTRQLLAEKVASRTTRPLVVLDIALPRDVEASVRDMENVLLLDLEDLDRLCPVPVGVRRVEIERGEALAVQEAAAITTWLRVRAVGPSIVDLRRRADEIRDLELRRAAPRLGDLTPAQRAAVDKVTRAIVSKLLHGPTVALREAAAAGSPHPKPDTVLDVLRLDRLATHEKIVRLQSAHGLVTPKPRTGSHQNGRVRPPA